MLGSSQLYTNNYLLCGMRSGRVHEHQVTREPIMAFQEAMAALKLIFFFILSDEVPNRALWVVVDPPVPKSVKSPNTE